MMKSGRIFSGARPTGRQHIGNYLGALQNWVKLQDEYNCIYCIVDIHALTSLEDTIDLQKNINEMIMTAYEDIATPNFRRNFCIRQFLPFHLF